ncbi:uncharacterized protein LOC9630383 isoform X2 [Selaginella moellendorffii]|uniref:uncharacterized protein LOC9642160 isoform X2 n=1 Tax=Selaginella moellendorffii TaxID=88036 RepID=UPI000D1CB7E7|nr:uncharacterized protein LOC9642160 isoform X2 [Selaginella moellendorffii]XP_024536169.1 uncharacterized protein LOC9630383 isoform X2 [Selaginella moellendorffii]|eukprot:XP_024534247.1 uncharacterized protein LOC9642160 isoform X2 [Selaginella moellendorffii]
MASHVPDFFYKEALRLRYVARSAFKLVEIQEKHRILKPGAAILDLGCAPGAWLQVACQNLGTRDQGGVVVGVDTKKINVPGDHTDHRVKAIAADVMKIKPETLAAMTPEKAYNVILSDMCPSVSGIGFKDATLSAELGSRALELALGFHPDDERDSTKKVNGLLVPSGSLVIKLLEGEESQGFPDYCNKYFRSVSWLRPKASRSTSREIYLIAKGRNRCQT